MEMIKIRCRFKHNKRLRTFLFLFEQEVPRSWLSVCTAYISNRFGEIYNVDSDKCSREVVDFSVYNCSSGFAIDEKVSHSYLFDDCNGCL